jgi:protoheme IX farnesyltransferase
MASARGIDWLLMFNAILGTSLAAAAAAVLNQWIESNVDRLMERTRHRPLPAGRMKPRGRSRSAWVSRSSEWRTFG